MTALKTRPPTGRVPWPLILVEGGEKSGKSWAAAVLSASPRVGRTFWIDLGEGAGDEYGAIPGVRYEICPHDGTWQQIMAWVEHARDEAKRAAAAGEPPVVLVIDTMTLIWEMLKDWVTARARKAPSNQKLLKADPNAEINISSNWWNDANARHRKLMTTLMTFPGIAVVTARGKEVTAMTNGQPDPRKAKEYRVEGQKDLAYDATAWVRLSRSENPVIVGARSVHAGIKPGEDRPLRKPGLTLEQLIFEVLKCDPATAHVRDLVPLMPGDAGPDVEAAEQAGPALASLEQRNELVTLLKRADLADKHAAIRYINGVIRPATVEGTAELTAEQILVVIGRVRSYIDQQTPPASTDAAGGAVEPAATAPPAPAATPMVTDAQHRHMHALWRELRYDGDHNRDNRLAVMAKVLGRPVETSKTLTHAEADRVIAAQTARRDAAAATQAPATESPAAPMSPDQRTELLALLAGRVGSDTAAYLAALNEAIAPDQVTSAKQLTEFQAAQAIGHLRGMPVLVPA